MLVCYGVQIRMQPSKKNVPSSLSTDATSPMLSSLQMEDRLELFSETGTLWSGNSMGSVVSRIAPRMARSPNISFLRPKSNYLTLVWACLRELAPSSPTSSLSSWRQRGRVHPGFTSSRTRPAESNKLLSSPTNSYSATFQKEFSILSYPQQIEPNNCPSMFYFMLKTSGTGIWFIFLSMGQNWKYLLEIIQPLFLYCFYSF